MRRADVPLCRIKRFSGTPRRTYRVPAGTEVQDPGIMASFPVPNNEPQLPAKVFQAASAALEFGNHRQLCEHNWML